MPAPAGVPQLGQNLALPEGAVAGTPLWATAATLTLEPEAASGQSCVKSSGRRRTLGGVQGGILATGGVRLVGIGEAGLRDPWAR